MLVEKADVNPGRGFGSKAPVALFVYNRPWHTQKTVEALKENAGAAETDLVIFSDAPARRDAQRAVQDVRKFVSSIRGFRSVRVILREKNYGLAKSIVDGVSLLCKEYGRVIVLEDDLVTSPWFLTYMNEALTFYRDEEKVISIHGFMFPVEAKLPETFFLIDPGCWGWATWARGWDLFEPDGEKLLRLIKERGLESEFNFSNSYDYLGMLESQVLGRNDSWAVRWYASAFLQGRLTLYPGRSLVSNIGNDGSGRHADDTERFSGEISLIPVRVARTPLAESAVVRAALVNYLGSIRQSWLRRNWGSILRKVAQAFRF